uniref:Metallophos domain-containing protein n=1 Tax=Syphacia muris TaxID=451379 RepID=A0A0N5AF62_9BILA
MNQIVILGNSIEKQNLFNVSDDELVLYFTADPQLYWKCEYTNRNCINFSKQFKSVYNLAEKKFSKLMAKMALTLRPNSSVLIINGDLTAFGHLQEFCKFWLHFPIQLLPGLGNHDYENNIDDCFLNNCANRMLKDNSSYVDSYNGSFSYTKTVCTENGITCVHIIQLHNRLGYTTEFSGWDGDWTIRSNIQWFDDVIKSYRHSQQPIFINLHQLDNTSLTTIVQVISKHFKGLSTRPQIFVLFAHLHSKHEIRLNCVGYKIPFIYVGSVPNNKYALQI